MGMSQVIRSQGHLIVKAIHKYQYNFLLLIHGFYQAAAYVLVLVSIIMNSMMLGLVLVSFFTGEMMIRSCQKSFSLSYCMKLLFFSLHLFSAWPWIFFCVQFEPNYNQNWGKKSRRWPDRDSGGPL